MYQESKDEQDREDEKIQWFRQKIEKVQPEHREKADYLEEHIVRHLPQEQQEVFWRLFNWVKSTPPQEKKRKLEIEED